MRYAEVTDMKRIFGGTLTLKNGRIDKYQFDEGYCWITGSVLMIIFQDRQSINGNVNETSNELS